MTDLRRTSTTTFTADELMLLLLPQLLLLSMLIADDVVICAVLAFASQLLAPWMCALVNWRVARRRTGLASAAPALLARLLISRLVNH